MAAALEDSERDNPIQKYLTQALSMIDIYKAETEGDFVEWLNKFEYIADSIGVPVNIMNELFKYMVDDSVHRVVQENYKNVYFLILSYEKRTDYYIKLFSNIKGPNSYRKRFYCRKQFKQETIEVYVKNLKKIFYKCQFKNQWNKILCSQFVNGLRNEKLQKYLNKIHGIEFKELVKKAVEFEKGNLIPYYRTLAFSMINIYNLQNKDDFCEWINRFKYAANTIKVPDHNMNEFFNEMVDDDVHTLVQANNKNVNFLELSYEEKIDYYINTLSSSKEDNSFRKRLKYRKQFEDESIEIYADNLQKIYNKCNYTIISEEILCEKFINGIRSDSIRKLLIKFPKLSFNQMVAKAVEIERDYQIQPYLDKALSMIDTYKKGNEGDFCEWLKKFEYVANSITVPNNKMNDLFKYMVDDEIHTLAQEKNENLDFLQVSYEEKILYYLNTFSSSKDDNSFKKGFKYPKQFEDESIELFAYNLIKIYEKFIYADTFEETLCEQIINGIKNDTIRKLLINLPIKSFYQLVDKVVEIERDYKIQPYLDQALSMIDIYKIGYKGEFCDWLNKFEYVANTIGVPDDQMNELFKYMVDDSMHRIVQENYKNVNFLQLSYEKQTDYYIKLFSNIKGLNSYRKRFNCRKQYEQETIEVYAENFKKIFFRCDYRNEAKKMLCTQFINGLRNKKLKKYLSEIPDFEFKEMVEKAIEFEKGNLIPYYQTMAYRMIHTYKKGNEGDFCEWLNRFEYAANTIEVPDHNMNEFFNEMVDDDVHTIVQANNKNINFLQLSYEEKINYYLNTLSSSKEDNSFRKRFKCRKQFEEESTKLYADNLQKIFDKCNYTNYCEEILCEQFINGIRDDRQRQHLKKLPILSFNQMVAKAVEFEKVYQIQPYLDQALTMIDIYKRRYDGDICEWINKFEYVADIIGVPENKMKEFFKHMVDDDVHTFTQRNYKNVDFSQLSYKEIINYYINTFSLVRGNNSYQKLIKCREQYEQETLEIYARNLQKICNKCNYSKKSNEILCTHFINGVRNEEMKKYLSQFQYHDFKKLVVLAVEFEKNYSTTLL